jgi:hypothetical protein
VGNERLGVSVQQLLPVWDGGRADSIRDGRPHRGGQEDPGHGRPPGMRDQTLQDVIRASLNDEAFVGDDDGASDCEVDEEKVEDGLALDQDGEESAEHTLSRVGVTLVQGRAKGAGGLEGSRSTAEPLRQNEGADQTDGEVGRHPNLVASEALTGMVARRNVEDELHNAPGDDGGEGRANEPAELVVAREDNQGPAEDENDGERKEGDSKEKRVETEDADKERADARAGRHVLDRIAEEVEVHAQGILDSADGPPRPLLQMAREVLRHRSELERLVDIGRGPSLSDEEIRRGDIFGDAADGNAADIVEGRTAADIAGAGAPGGVEGILDWLGYMNEEVEGLADWVRTGRVVEELGRAGHGHLVVGEQVREDSTQPVRLGNLQSSLGQSRHFFSHCLHLCEAKQRADSPYRHPERPQTRPSHRAGA